MKPKLWPALGCLILLACADPVTQPEDDVFVTGVITSRAPFLVGVQTSVGVRIDSMPQMMVSSSANDCGGARILFSAGTPIHYRNGTAADTGVLVIGRAVSVWTEGVVLLSCPPIANASYVRVDGER